MTATLMSDKDRIEDLIRNTRILRDWTITTDWDNVRDENSAAFLLEANRIDSDDPTQMNYALYRLHCGLDWSSDRIIRWLKGGQILIADHEVYEYFTVYGEHVTDPHPEKGDLNNPLVDVLVGSDKGRGWFLDPGE